MNKWRTGIMRKINDLYISQNKIKNFKMRNGLLENEMVIETQSIKIEMEINKVVQTIVGLKKTYLIF